MGTGWGKFPRPDEYGRDTVGHSSNYCHWAGRSHSVLQSLAKASAFADCSNIANLAYWVIGTEGSNPSLSANDVFIFFGHDEYPASYQQLRKLDA